MAKEDVFREPFNKLFIPMFPFAVAWVIDRGFVQVEYVSFVREPVAFILVAMAWHTAQIFSVYFLVRWGLAFLVRLALAFKRGRRIIFFSYSLIGFTLINLALLGATLGAAALLERPSHASDAPLDTLLGVNALWFVAAFLIGREFLRLLQSESRTEPASAPGAAEAAVDGG
jgi:hypothetical protein